MSDTPESLSPQPPEPFTPLAPLSRLAWAACLAVAAFIIGLAVSGRLDDPDVWQHLAVGRALWTLHAIPRTDVWTWPEYGGPYIVPSWLFRVLLWPWWVAGHEWGLLAWRWVTTLGAFAILWRVTRRMGATGLVPVVVLVWTAIFYRQRSQVRPETLVALLLAAEFWLLEARRQGARVHLAWLPVIACLWTNAHMSFYWCFALGGAYFLDALWRRLRGDANARPWPLAIALVAAVAACLVNPFGLVALGQPLDFLMHLRHEPMYRLVSELQPIDWTYNQRNGLMVFVAASLVLAVLRAWRRRTLDLAEFVLLAVATPQFLGSQRFIGFWALIAGPFLARDLADALRDVHWPAAFARPGVRPALACAACVLVAAPELTRPEWPLAVHFNADAYPVAACDWIAAHDVRGRAFDAFSDGGYILWRFWPDTGRLPYMDIHLTGPRHDRDLYAYAWSDPASWYQLAAERRFDWLLLRRRQGTAQHIVDYLDADSTYALVFADDVAALYLRRSGALAPLVRRYEYSWVPAGTRLLVPMVQGILRDPNGRAHVRAELERQITESPRTAQARSQLANVEGMDGHWARMITLLEQARAIDPRLPALAPRIAFARGRLGLPPERALRRPR